MEIPPHSLQHLTRKHPEDNRHKRKNDLQLLRRTHEKTAEATTLEDGESVAKDNTAVNKQGLQSCLCACFVQEEVRAMQL